LIFDCHAVQNIHTTAFLHEEQGEHKLVTGAAGEAEDDWVE
jgi:hypothetical protein